MVEASIPQKDMDALLKQMDRASQKLGKGLRESVAWAGNYVAISLGAITKVGKAKRKVYQRPDGKWRTDKRVGRYGTYKYKQGEKYWVPIYRTGEFGLIRFTSKKQAIDMQWHKSSGKVVKVPTGSNPETQIPGIMQSPKLIIGRRGLAKRSYKFLQTKMRVGGTIQDHATRTGAIGAVIWRGIGGINPTLIINNDLRYALTAMKGKQPALNRVVGKASRNMAREINRLIKESLPK